MSRPTFEDFKKETNLTQEEIAKKMKSPIYF